jgi:hypothetical protein
MCKFKKNPLIISGTDAAIWSKTLGLLTTITLKVVPLPVHVPFPELLTFFLSPSIFLDHLSCVKMAASQFYSQSAKQRKVGGGGESHIPFGQKFPGEKGLVTDFWYKAILLLLLLLFTKFIGKIILQKLNHFIVKTADTRGIPVSPH